MGQLRAVASQVKTLSGATGTCVTTLQRSLDTTIGSTDQPCPASGSTTLVCKLTGAGTTLTTVAGDLARNGAKILTEFDTEAAGDAGAGWAR